MTSLSEIVEFVKDDLIIVKKNIQELSKKESEYSEEISKRLSYVLSSPGKQLRPVITLICSKLFGKFNKENSLRMATAVELLHIATLIHDDTVDKADVRRGKATASNLWGNNIAVLLGDYVFATSAIFVCNTGNITLVKRFAETIVELSKGELFENIESNNFSLTKEKYFEKTYLKTASLFKTASFSGSIIGGGSDENIRNISKFGFHFGMAYQIQDDILDITSSKNKEGKPVLNDLSEGVITLPIILYLKSKKYNNDLIKKFAEKEKEGLLEEIINSKSIEESKKIANIHYKEALTCLLNIPKSKYKKALESIIEISKKRI
tara:strand:+ start:2389 stop:3354 length:966 start_codon:yes stop_codon:yes gene_type:complete